MTEAFFLPECDQKLILPYQLALLLQVNLYVMKSKHGIKDQPLRPVYKHKQRPLLDSVVLNRLFFVVLMVE